MKIADKNKKNIIIISLIICVSIVIGAVLSANYDISEQLSAAENRYQEIIDQENTYSKEQESLINECYVVTYFNLTKQVNDGYVIIFENYFETHDDQGFYDVLSEYNSLLSFADDAELKIGAIQEDEDLVVFQLNTTNVEGIRAAICSKCKVIIKKVDNMIFNEGIKDACVLNKAKLIEQFNDKIQAKVDIESAKQSKCNPLYYSLTLGVMCSAIFYGFKRYKNGKD